jgi:hypothetical protein
MSTRANPHRSLAGLLQSVEAKVEAGVVTASNVAAFMGNETRNDLKELTAGDIPAAFIDKYNPFARGKSPSANFARGGSVQRRRVSQSAAMKAIGRRTVPLLPINKRSGRLHRSVMLRKKGSANVRFGARESYSVIVGTNLPYTQFIFSPYGTRFMVGRGILDEVDKRMRTRFAAFPEEWRRGWVVASSFNPQWRVNWQATAAALGS